MKTITTLSQLADIINNSEDFPVAIVDKAIEENGWQDDRGETWGVCRNETEVLELDEDGKAVVFPNNGDPLDNK